MLGDFPFADQASQAHTIGLILTPFVRDVIDGPVPLHGVDAPMAGTGKGLVLNAVAMVSTGRRIEVMTDAKDGEELRKRITALLLAGGPLGLFDNVARRLASDVLAALLTSETWTDRVLGVSRVVRVPNRAVWLATGNNLTFSKEMARRTVWIRMDAKTPEPHLRNRFRHDHLLPWVASHRRDLVRAVLALIRRWISLGRPRFTARRLGSFEGWGEVIGGILTTAGIGGFLGNLEAFSVRADKETTEWKAFTGEWRAIHGKEPVDVGALYSLAVALLPETLGDGNERSQRIRLGKALAKRSEWTFDVGGVAVKLRESEVTDERGRRRVGWKLMPAVVTNSGTLGKTLGGSKDSKSCVVPRVRPYVPVSGVTGGAWGEL